MKRAVGFIILLAVGLGVVVVLNRDQGSHAIEQDFIEKVLSRIDATETDRVLLRDWTQRNHPAVFAAHSASGGQGVKDGNAYTIGMLTRLADEATSQGKTELATRLRAEAEAYRK